MKNLDLQLKLVFTPEKSLKKKKWDNINDLVTVNESQYSFGKEDIQKQFFDSLNLNPKDKKKI